MLQIIHGNKASAELTRILNRAISETSEIEQQTKGILAAVRAEGDAAVKRYTERFDKVAITDFEVTQSEFDAAFADIDEQLVAALEAAKANIEAYHRLQLQEGYAIQDEEKMLKQIVSPIERAGVYVPGGKAAYPSTVLMNVVPAKIAGVADITMVTPPDANGNIQSSLLVAAKLAGVTRVLKMGGAQSIAALAYGTETVVKVDKIVGPGNAYVAMAKNLVSGVVGIDMIAGPSEVVVLADETATPAYIVADLMAQAEHDEMASGIVITTSEKIAKEVARLAPEMVAAQPRRDIITAAFKDYGAIIVVDTMEAGIALVNTIAPEHLEIFTADALDIYPQIRHAGAIFLGAYTPESVGDYYAGTNHTLPTNATARFSSPLNVNDFQKKTSVVYYSREALAAARPHIELIADAEGLYAHRDAVSIRFEEEDSLLCTK
ncbi:MAG: histidinol dehydrogenase [Turicibacter sp.]|nr:histidinol dehydrogenase [Turicibacter sp.]